ncbi:MAG: hypothetical protein AAFU72_12935 [Pseudomonadota bacterium]
MNSVDEPRARTRGMRAPVWLIVGVLAVLGSALIVFGASIVAGPPIGHSHHFNVGWLGAFADAWRIDNPYPRWLPLLWDGSGGPAFYFYPPLFFVVSAAPIELAGMAPEKGMVVAAVLFHLAASCGTFLLARSLGLGTVGAVGAAVALVFLPYHLRLWVDRGAYGELAAYATLPFLFYGVVEALGRGRGWLVVAAASCATVLAHILAAALAGLGIFALLWVYRDALAFRRLVALVLAGGLGLLAAALYWVPALVLTDTVVGIEALGTQRPSNSYLSWRTLSEDDMLGALYRSALALSAVVLVSFALMPSPPRLRGFVITALGATWFMMTPLAGGIYLYTPLDIIQFTWRFLTVTEIALALGLGAVLQGIAASFRVARVRALLLGGAALAGLAIGQPPWWSTDRQDEVAWILGSHPSPVEWLSYNGRGDFMSYRDFVPYRRLPEPLEGAPLIAVADEAADLEVLGEAGTEIVFRLEHSAPVDLVFRRGFWAYWQLEPVAGGDAVPLDATAGYPLIKATLPAGAQTWRLWLRTPMVVWLGLALSVVGVALIVAQQARVLRLWHTE